MQGFFDSCARHIVRLSQRRRQSLHEECWDVCHSAVHASEAEARMPCMQVCQGVLSLPGKVRTGDSNGHDTRVISGKCRGA
eukprot:469676-Pleurochrysis_carterae.AAC.2